jgi:hypothetical protein
MMAQIHPKSKVELALSSESATKTRLAQWQQRHSAQD